MSSQRMSLPAPGAMLVCFGKCMLALPPHAAVTMLVIGQEGLCSDGDDHLNSQRYHYR